MAGDSKVETELRYFRFSRAENIGTTTCGGMTSPYSPWYRSPTSRVLSEP
jgi:hypothetical protein